MWLLILSFSTFLIAFFQCSSKKDESEKSEKQSEKKKSAPSFEPTKTVTMPPGLLSNEKTSNYPKMNGGKDKEVSKTQEASENQKNNAGNEEENGEKKEKKGMSKTNETQAATNDTQTVEEGKGAVEGKTQESISGRKKGISKRTATKGPSAEKTQGGRTEQTVASNRTVNKTMETKVSAESTKPSSEMTKPSDEKVKVDETVNTVEETKPSAEVEKTEEKKGSAISE